MIEIPVNTTSKLDLQKSESQEQVAFFLIEKP
jgi:hypothetical protein